jgi:hypothetical protein
LETTFTVPYVSDYTFLSKNPGTETSTYPGSGHVYVSIDNALSSSASPVSPVRLLVWACAGADFQFAFPHNRELRNHVLPVEPTLESFDNDTSDDEYEEPAAHPNRYEGGTAAERRNLTYEPLNKAVGYLDDGVCFGDYPDDLTDVFRRYQPVLDYITADNDSVSLNMHAGWKKWTSKSNPNFAWNPNFLMHFSNIFRFQRGSFNIRVQGNAANYVIVTLDKIESRTVKTEFPEMVNEMTTTDAQLFRRFTIGGEMSSHMTQNTTVNIPYYSNANIIPTDVLPDRSTIHPWINIGVPTTTQLRVFMAAGDDYSMGFRLGVPYSFYAEPGDLELLSRGPTARELHNLKVASNLERLRTSHLNSIP